MSKTEFFAAAAALAVFCTVLVAFLSIAANREREAARKQWQNDLRTKGA